MWNHTFQLQIVSFWNTLISSCVVCLKTRRREEKDKHRLLVPLCMCTCTLGDLQYSLQSYFIYQVLLFICFLVAFLNNFMLAKKGNVRQPSQDWVVVFPVSSLCLKCSLRSCGITQRCWSHQRNSVFFVDNIHRDLSAQHVPVVSTSVVSSEGLTHLFHNRYKSCVLYCIVFF